MQARIGIQNFLPSKRDYERSLLCFSHLYFLHTKNVSLGLRLTSSLDKRMYKMTWPDRIGTFVLTFSLIFAAVLSANTIKTTLLFLGQNS